MDPAIIEKLKTKVSIQFGIEFAEYLGEGSYSVAYAAQAGRVPCAIKFSKEPFGQSVAGHGNDKGVDRERKALDLVLKVNGHPHIVSLMDLWEIAPADGSGSHLVTRWELGTDSIQKRLSQCVAQGLPGIPRPELFAYMRQAADAIDFLNINNIMHRDIKPENLLLFHDQVKLIDLGFAKELDSLETQKTQGAGSPAYMPPEIHEGSVKDDVDVYCLAATFVHCATGKLPFGNRETTKGKEQDIHSRKKAGLFEQQGLNPQEVQALTRVLVDRESLTAGELIKELMRSPPITTQGQQKEPRLSKWWKKSRDEPISEPSSASLLNKLDQAKTASENLRQQQQQVVEQTRQQEYEHYYKLLEVQFEKHDFSFALATADYLNRLDKRETQELQQVRARLGTMSLQPKVSLIPASRFQMGSSPDEEKRQKNEQLHWVEITKPFYLDQHQPTLGRFREFVYETGYKTEAERDGKGGVAIVDGELQRKPEFVWHNPGFTQSDDDPVVQVTWNDAFAYCEWQSKQSGKICRLPTEAEWECAWSRRNNDFLLGWRRSLDVGRLGQLQWELSLRTNQESQERVPGTNYQSRFFCLKSLGAI
jgi:formylglycine-generating enzyme required for sulfatase activity